MNAQEETTVRDANGDPVSLTESQKNLPAQVLIRFFAGRVPAPACPHYIAQSEARAGFRTCERC